MGRTPKPIKFLIHPSLAEIYPWHELVQQGHTVIYMGPECTEFDLLLGPECWRMDERLIKYLDLAIKAARGVKYPKVKK